MNHQPTQPPYGPPPQVQHYPQQPQVTGRGVPATPGPGKTLGPGAIVGIIAGALVGVVALGAVVVSVAGGHDSKDTASSSASSADNAGGSPHKSGSSRQRYRLTVPPTLIDGQYTLSKDITQMMDDGLAGQRDGASGHNMRGAGGQYKATSGEQGTLVASGIYGEVSDPKYALEQMFKGLTEHDGVEVTTQPHPVAVPGVDEPVSCEVFTFRQNPVGACGWSDHSTVAVVTIADAAEPVSLDVLARKAAVARSEMRVPVG
ncbi:hypothetical protein [Streptomyces huiliensis]|uniref:hypothetical protein n=1 Tax=Streptomyces huiliensis TaxID=2876027 RepID=UPI001CC127EC|nr:hypothetical protein [Streptomyces huiliensis]MBZ4319954.1 hypothetical protein [Streptomyces huiliensis]